MNNWFIFIAPLAFVFITTLCVAGLLLIVRKSKHNLIVRLQFSKYKGLEIIHKGK